MAAISEEIPLWRIHDLGTGSGTTHNIVNIERPDTIALLRHLGEGDPIKATRCLVLAADYKLDPATLREATLARIEKVFADPTGKIDSFNAKLLLLRKCRVNDVVTSDPFPRASRLPDLAPLWRILGFDPIRNSTCMSNEDIRIKNIRRPDTIALLTALGGGDVTRATGHLVIACNFKDDLGVGLEAALARVWNVSEGDPPLTCSLSMLGRIRCAEITTEGPFPQVLMEEVPVWKIHNLATRTQMEHKITDIERPDSLALLAYLGRGDPLAAIGSLVIACDFKAPPCAGDSATLMRITVVKGGRRKYDAKLVEVSSTDVGRIRTDVGRADWWPRVTIELPKNITVCVRVYGHDIGVDLKLSASATMKQLIQKAKIEYGVHDLEMEWIGPQPKETEFVIDVTRNKGEYAFEIKRLHVCFQAEGKDDTFIFKLPASATMGYLIKKAKKEYGVNDLEMKWAGKQPKSEDVVIDVTRKEHAGEPSRPFLIKNITVCVRVYGHDIGVDLKLSASATMKQLIQKAKIEYGVHDLEMEWIGPQPKETEFVIDVTRNKGEYAFEIKRLHVCFQAEGKDDTFIFKLPASATMGYLIKEAKKEYGVNDLEMKWAGKQPKSEDVVIDVTRKEHAGEPSRPFLIKNITVCVRVYGHDIGVDLKLSASATMKQLIQKAKIEYGVHDLEMEWIGPQPKETEFVIDVTRNKGEYAFEIKSPTVRVQVEGNDDTAISVKLAAFETMKELIEKVKKAYRVDEVKWTGKLDELVIEVTKENHAADKPSHFIITDLTVCVQVEDYDNTAVSLKLAASATTKQLIDEAKKMYGVDNIEMVWTAKQPESNELVIDITRKEMSTPLLIKGTQSMKLIAVQVANCDTTVQLKLAASATVEQLKVKPCRVDSIAGNEHNVCIQVKDHKCTAMIFKLAASKTMKDLICEAKTAYGVNDLEIKWAGEQPQENELVLDVMSKKHAESFIIKSLTVCVQVESGYHPVVTLKLAASATIQQLIEEAKEMYKVENLVMELAQNNANSLVIDVTRVKHAGDMSKPFRIMADIFDIEVLAMFIETYAVRVCHTTYLIVKYITVQNGKQRVRLKFYKKSIDSRGRRVHPEITFIADLVNFPEDTTFELYMNYSPCVAERNEKGERIKSCCDQLLSMFGQEKNMGEIFIYTAWIYTKFCYFETLKTKFYNLKKDAKISVKPLTSIELLSLFPSEYGECLKSRLTLYKKNIENRNKTTADDLQEIYNY